MGRNSPCLASGAVEVEASPTCSPCSGQRIAGQSDVAQHIDAALISGLKGCEVRHALSEGIQRHQVGGYAMGSELESRVDDRKKRAAGEEEEE